MFVSSSDRTRDVFEKVFAGFDRAWPECPYPRFVGFTAPDDYMMLGFTVVRAQGESGWAAELADQLRALPAGIEHVLLLLDDFLLQGRVPTTAIADAYALVRCGDLPYLRLRPVERSFVVRALNAMTVGSGPLKAVRLKRSENYYSALQAAIWSRAHLMRCLQETGSIWDFEHMTPEGAPHHAVSWRVLFYRHVVQKGKWRAYAPGLFAREGSMFNAGARAIRPPKDRAWFLIERLKFGLLGYSMVNARRWLALRRTRKGQGA